MYNYTDMYDELGGVGGPFMSFLRKKDMLCFTSVYAIRVCMDIVRCSETSKSMHKCVNCWKRVHFVTHVAESKAIFRR